LSLRPDDAVEDLIVDLGTLADSYVGETCSDL
jgi:hypothetical protein